ncbi:MAG TPA: hypothetical protein VHZ77_08410 [Gaiellaceae bacterium]|nr:hypothetical protein [Gaiellaceae bacterium]
MVLGVAAIGFGLYQNHHGSVNAHPPPVVVLEARKPIVQGTTAAGIRQGAGYTRVAVPLSQVETGAIVDPAELAGKVAVQDIDAGQQLTATEFGPAPTGSPGPSIRALVIGPTWPNEIGRQIKVGTHIDVSVAAGGKLRGLYGNMDVLAIGSDGGTVTLEATRRQAGRLISISQNGRDRLVVRLHR